MFADESIFVGKDINQKEKLLVMLRWQFSDVTFEVNQVLDCLVNDFLL